MELKRIKLVRRIIASLIALSAAIAGGWIWWAMNQTPWRSSPDAVRPNASLWSDLTEPAVAGTRNQVFEDTRVEPAEKHPQDRLRWWYRRETLSVGASERFVHPSDCEIVWASGDGVAQLPNDAGSLRLKAVAFAYRGDWEFDPLAKNWSPRAHPVYVDPLTHAPMKEPPVSGGIRFESSMKRPALRWVLELENAETEVHVVRSEPKVFDARTQTHLTPRQAFYRNKDDDSAIVIDSFLDLWHDTDLALVLDMAVGPPVEFHIPNQPNWQTTMDGFRVQYIAPLPGKLVEHRQSRSDPELASLETDIDEERSTSCALFRFEPAAFGNLVTISAETNDSRTHFERLVQFGDERLFRSEPYEVAADEIMALRGRYLGHVVRVVFVLPGIPGMQNPRDEVDNLFKINIPEFRAENQFELQDFIQQSTQMEMTGSFRSSFPQGYFPRTYENVTPQQLLTEWETNTPGPEITTRSRDHLIVRDAKPEWRDKLKMWWAKVWN